MKSNIIEPKNTDFLKFIKEVESSKKDTKSFSKRDQNFALMTELEGWKDFKEMATTRIDKLMSMRDYDASGRDLSELGLRFLVADIVSGEIMDMIKRVDQAKGIYDEEQKDK